MRHILFEIPTPWFSIPAMGYGLMIVLGFLCGIALANWRARRCGENPEHVMNLGLWAVVGGIGGARLLFIVEHPETFAGRGFFGGLLAAVNLRHGGLVFYGGMLLAIALAVLYIRRKKLSARRMLDILAPSLMLGLAFGRAGCLLNGCCWGGKCTLESGWARELVTITFPFASPPFDQQAERLPWRVVNTDGEFYGYYVPAVFGRDTRHIAADAGFEPAGPYVTVPVQFLRPPPMASDVEELPWKVLDENGDVLGYYVHSLAAEDSDGRRKFRLSTSAPDGPTVGIPRQNILERPDGPLVIHTLTAREKIRASEDRRVARMFRSLPVYSAQQFGMANALLLCWILTLFFRLRKREGQVFALMLILYPVSRFLLEGVRRSSDLLALDLTLSQHLSLWVFLGGVAMWVVLWYLPPVAPVPLSGPARPDK